MTKGIDTTVSTITVAQLDAGNYDFVCRYILNAPGSSLNKQLTKAEPARFSAGGKRVVSNFEWAERPPDTVAEGRAHARAFLDWAADFKPPDWSPCYFSQDANNPAGAYVNYFTGVCDIVGPERSAVYGNGACYRYLLSKKLVSYAWQSKSSGYAGNHDTTGANLVQQLSTASVGGHTVDVNIAKTALYGGWLLGEDDPNMTTVDLTPEALAAIAKVIFSVAPPAGASAGDVIANPDFRPDHATNPTTGAAFALGDMWQRVGDIQTALAGVAAGVWHTNQFTPGPDGNYTESGSARMDRLDAMQAYIMSPQFIADLVAAIPTGSGATPAAIEAAVTEVINRTVLSVPAP